MERLAGKNKVPFDAKRFHKDACRYYSRAHMDYCYSRNLKNPINWILKTIYFRLARYHGKRLTKQI